MPVHVFCYYHVLWMALLNVLTNKPVWKFVTPRQINGSKIQLNKKQISIVIIFFGRGGGGEGGLRWGGQVSGASFSPLSCACHSFLFLFWLAMAWARNQNFKTRTWSVDSTYRVFPWLAPLARYFLKQWAMFDISTFLHGSEALQSFKAFIISQFQKETRKQRNHH